MPKFKVGDRVKFTQQFAEMYKNTPQYDQTMKDRATVIAVKNDEVKVDWDSKGKFNKMWAFEGNLELE